MSERQKEIRDLINELKLLLNIKDENVEININENKDVITVTARRKSEEGEIFVVIPKT